MFKLSDVQVRLYEFENPDDMTVLHIKPPSLDTLEIFNKVFSDTASSPKELAGVTGTILSNNEEGLKITGKTVMRWMTTDILAAFVEDFLGWLNDTKQRNPN